MAARNEWDDSFVTPVRDAGVDETSVPSTSERLLKPSRANVDDACNEVFVQRNEVVAPAGGSLLRLIV